mmetsp:Transcript_31309/g.43406  ORF Transcript_31309/g.43406 Transcript_31309/m.43406 type:complete len:346 (+) Transcript_31309:33-1070(+)|eukprot:CAMPEP_0196587864 /NCGR_PEP_ID=MMETSP1081-20130531/58847_1 /TAXON_ID=36882 /ORGANISM="Pyramimonas amylifera, Strain CCMP720" /LENGTH=345 /DNA_ID=CAMNT_0041910183 /DNA_START=33 /DNA_END=1070 /DNA_ORIENTATION=-
MDPTSNPTKNLGGFRKNEDVKDAVSTYESYHTSFGGTVDDRKSFYADMVNKYYDLATSFYEFGWGESFHFAHQLHGETLREAIKRHEHYLGLKLQIGSSSKVLDLGCGVGGPLREIAEFTGATVTGLNNNEYQVNRGRQLCKQCGHGLKCNFVKADFMNIPFPDSSFDAAYQIEATCHAPDYVGVYKEILRVLKPGALFAGYEWCMTDKYDPMNEEHRRIKAEIELGNGLPDLNSTRGALHMLKKAGFEVLEEQDLILTAEVPWYEALSPARLGLSSFRTSFLGRFFTRNMVWFLELIGLAPKGSVRVSSFLERAADSLVIGGKMGIFTPMYFYKVRKPSVRMDE